MGDLALNAPEGTKPKKSGKKIKKINGLDVQADMEIKVQRERADAAESRIREIEDAPILLIRLDDSELSSMLQQQHMLDTMVEKSNKAAQEAKDSQTVVIMLNSAYNTSWVVLKKKYGLPEDVDVDWTTGEIFRKKAPARVDNIKEG